jgi:hypothetical protein
MLYVLTATSKQARHATALGMFDTPGMANLAAAMLRSNSQALGVAGEISVHTVPPHPASALGALLEEIHPEGLDDAALEVDENFARSVA